MLNVFLIGIIIAGVMTISARGAVHSVLWLILAFSSAIVVMISFKVDFLALIVLIVYVGAISILFIFVIMMLNLTGLKGSLDMSNYIPIGFLIGIVCFFEILLYLNLGPDSLKGADYFRWDFIEKTENIQALGIVLYTSYSYLFILSGLILLIALMGAMIITYYKGGPLAELGAISHRGLLPLLPLEALLQGVLILVLFQERMWLSIQCEFPLGVGSVMANCWIGHLYRGHRLPPSNATNLISDSMYCARPFSEPYVVDSFTGRAPLRIAGIPFESLRHGGDCCKRGRFHKLDGA